MRGTNGIYIRLLETSDTEAHLDLRIRNRDHFKPFEPIREDSHYTLIGQTSEMAKGIQSASNDTGYLLGVFRVSDDALIGRMSLSGVSRAAFQNAYLGYYIDQSEQGKGYATAAVTLTAEYAFEELGLHRIQAGVMPRNVASIRVLEKAGFRQEGLAKRYLKINGEWEDHVLFALTSEEFEQPSSLPDGA